jgi:hypothetical protein
MPTVATNPRTLASKSILGGSWAQREQILRARFALAGLELVRLSHHDWGKQPYATITGVRWSITYRRPLGERPERECRLGDNDYNLGNGSLTPAQVDDLTLNPITLADHARRERLAAFRKDLDVQTHYDRASAAQEAYGKACGNLKAREFGFGRSSANPVAYEALERRVAEAEAAFDTAVGSYEVAVAEAERLAGPVVNAETLRDDLTLIRLNGQAVSI